MKTQTTKSLSKMFQIGCGDSSCNFGRLGGMHTNGGCHCPEFERPRQQTTEQMEERVLLVSGLHLLQRLAMMPGVEEALKAVVEKVIEKRTDLAKVQKLAHGAGHSCEMLAAQLVNLQKQLHNAQCPKCDQKGGVFHFHCEKCGDTG